MEYFGGLASVALFSHREWHERTMSPATMDLPDRDVEAAESQYREEAETCSDFFRYGGFPRRCQV